MFGDNTGFQKDVYSLISIVRHEERSSAYNVKDVNNFNSKLATLTLYF